MKQDIRTISHNITELVNNFVVAATSQVRSEGKPVYVSLVEAAPSDMSAYDVQHHIQSILEELSSRPEIKEISFPRTVEETDTAEKVGPLSLVVGCHPAYCKNLFDQGLEAEQGYMEPRRHLSIARKADVVENAIGYIQEESQDPVQDFTERLGFSMEELKNLGLFSPVFCPLRLDFVVEAADPATGRNQFASYKTFGQAMADWDEEQSLALYGETEYGTICLVRPDNSAERKVCLPLTTALLEAGLFDEDLPDALVDKLEQAMDLLSIHFPMETGLPSKLNQENAIGQTMYQSLHCFYGEILNMEPVFCTGFKPGEEEHLDQIRIERTVESNRRNLHVQKHILLRSQILLNKEDVLSEAAASWNLSEQTDRFPILAVSKNIQTGHIFMLPLEREVDPYDGTSKLRRWTQEYSIGGRAPVAGESLSTDGYEVFFFDSADLEGAVDQTIALMRPYVSEVRDRPEFSYPSLNDAIQAANNRLANTTSSPVPACKQPVRS